MVFKELPARYALAILGMFGVFTKFMLKVNLNVAVVEMVAFDQTQVNSTAQTDGAWETSTSEPVPYSGHLSCADASFAVETSSGNETKFQWTASQQGLVLGSFSYGDVAAQVVMAYLGRRYKQVRVLGIAMFCGGALTILTPIITESLGIAGLVAARIAVGFSTGATITLLVGLAGLWSPPKERSVIMSIIFAGIPLGNACTLLTGGLLAANSGWKSVFHVTGAGGLSWALLWILLAYETPSDHPRISDHEKEFISSSLEKGTPKDQESRKVPWRKIFTSLPVMAVVVAHFSSVYGYETLSSLFPTYLKTSQKLDTQTTGIISAIPFIINVPMNIMAGMIADFFIGKGIPVITVRKAFTATGMTTCAICIVSLGYTGCNLIAAATMATIVAMMDSLTVPGFKSCSLDIAPNLCGVIFSISVTVCQSTGFFAPQVAGALREALGFFGWQIAFWIAAAIYMVGMGQFMIFGTNEKQAWATDNRKTRPASVVTVEETIERDPSTDKKARPSSIVNVQETVG